MVERLTKEQLEELKYIAGCERDTMCFSRTEARLLIAAAEREADLTSLVRDMLPELEGWAQHHGHPTDGTGYFGSMFRRARTALEAKP